MKYVVKKLLMFFPFFGGLYCFVCSFPKKAEFFFQKPAFLFFGWSVGTIFEDNICLSFPVGLLVFPRGLQEEVPDVPADSSSEAKKKDFGLV